MKITFPLVTCFSVLCLTLAGCGGSDSNDNRSSSSTPSSSSSSSVVASSEPASSSSSESSIAVSSEASSEASSSEVASSESSSVDSSSSESSSSESSSSESSSESSASAWELVWFDEFDGESIDTAKWEHEVNCWGGGNNEAQCYTASPDNSYVSDGLLHIKAIYEGPGGVCGPAVNQEDPGYPGADVCKNYSSARLRTKGKGDWKYGRMEISAKMPSIGGGVWPAIWMLPTDTTTYGGWPHSGEIDILESFQPGVEGPQPTGGANEIHGTLHYGYSWPLNQNSGASYTPPTNIWEEFHTYAVEWEEGEIRWYVDDVLFARNSGNWFIYYWGGQEVGYQVGEGAQPFDQPFHMILNVALGNGDYVPLPTFGADDDVTMEVAYVKVYECSADPITGKGCETPTADESVTPTDVVGHEAPAADWDTRWLYRDGLETLEFTVDGAPVLSSLSLGNYACPAWEAWCPDGSAITVSEPTIADGPGGEPATVLDLEFAGISNAFIIVGDALSDDALDFGGSISEYGRAANLGEIKFDLRVLDIDPATRLLIKLDSGYPKNSYHEIEIPAENEWTEVAVRLYSLLPNTNEGYASPVDFRSIKNPFVIEPVGGNAHVQINNIRIVCQDSEEWGDCNINPVIPPEPVTEDMDIFVGGLSPEWGNPGFGVWQDGGQVITIDATVEDPDKGTVIEVEFTPTGMGTFYIQDTAPKDLSAFADGDLVFDLKVVSNNGNTSGFLVKADCVYPCVGAEVPVALPGDNEWHTITVPIASINQGGFNITNVNTPFSLWPVFGQQDVTFRVTNVRWMLPE